jgi:hypothetical protein
VAGDMTVSSLAELSFQELSSNDRRVNHVPNF